MGLSSFIEVGKFKSPLRTVAAALFRSRQTQGNRVEQKSEQIRDLKQTFQKHSQVIIKLQQQLAQKKLQVAQLHAENQRLQQQPPVLPHDPRLPHHEFGPKMISMCVNLAANVGLRASITCLEIVLDWLNITGKLPDGTTVRTGMMRVGVAAIEEPVEQADDWVWMADHSNQIGQEKALGAPDSASRQTESSLHESGSDAEMESDDFMATGSSAFQCSARNLGGSDEQKTGLVETVS